MANTDFSIEYFSLTQKRISSIWRSFMLLIKKKNLIGDPWCKPIVINSVVSFHFC